MVFARMTGAVRVIRLIAVLLAVWATPVVAHLTPNSEVTLTIASDSIAADVIVPQGEYGYATGNPVGNTPAAIGRARDYLARHVTVVSPDGSPWAIEWQAVEFKQIAGPPDLHATARLVPPAGASPRSFRVAWTVLLDELPSHFALFVLAGDSGGKVGERRTILGALRAGNTVLTVDRGEARNSVVFANAMLIGIEHIVEGYDHLLFLLALLLPAPLIAHGGRWSEPRPLRGTVIQLVRIVTAFTIGHSLTLVGATLGGWRLPTAPVEIAIAISVLVSAIHAIRPLLPGREHWIAVGFGLVHGLAFATLLSDAGTGQASTALSLLGFNLGIEVVQLAIVALVMPPLIMLARRRRFATVRITLASATALAALVWIADRSLGIGDALASQIDRVAAHGLWMVGGLYLLAIGATIAGRRRAQTKRAAPQDRPFVFGSEPSDQRE